MDSSSEALLDNHTFMENCCIMSSTSAWITAYFSPIDMKLVCVLWPIPVTSH